MWIIIVKRIIVISNPFCSIYEQKYSLFQSTTSISRMFPNDHEMWTSTLPHYLWWILYLQIIERFDHHQLIFSIWNCIRMKIDWNCLSSPWIHNILVYSTSTPIFHHNSRSNHRVDFTVDIINQHNRGSPNYIEYIIMHTCLMQWIEGQNV